MNTDNLHGLIVIDKPKGISSFDVIREIKKITRIKKIGHAGTLDPIATGVIVIALGNATRILEFLFTDDKEYIANIKIGEETDTLDITGKIIKTTENVANLNRLDSVINKFNGEIIQIPPVFSALKKDGKKFYEYAREGIEIEIPERKVTIHNLEIIEKNPFNIKIKAHVSKGTYIRSLCRDIAYELDTLGTMSSLVRTRSGKFLINNSMLLDNLNVKTLEKNLISMDKALDDYDTLQFEKKYMYDLINGIKIDAPEKYNEGTLLKVKYKDILYGLFQVKEGKLRVKKTLINLDDFKRRYLEEL